MRRPGRRVRGRREQPWRSLSVGAEHGIIHSRTSNLAIPAAARVTARRGRAERDEGTQVSRALWESHRQRTMVLSTKVDGEPSGREMSSAQSNSYLTREYLKSNGAGFPTAPDVDNKGTRRQPTHRARSRLRDVWGVHGARLPRPPRCCLVPAMVIRS
jgi:hypothetical protein